MQSLVVHSGLANLQTSLMEQQMDSSDPLTCPFSFCLMPMST